MNKKFKKKFREHYKFLEESKKFIYFIIVIYLIFLVIGWFLPFYNFDATIKDKFKQTDGLDFGELSRYIIFQNSKIFLYGIIFGFLSFVPVILAIINGCVVGIVLKNVFIKNGIGSLIHGLGMICLYGPFELFAFFVSMGLGLKLGMTLLFQPKKFWNYLGKSLNIYFFVLFPLTVFAGIIETILIFLL